MLLLGANSNTRLEWPYPVSQSTRVWNDLTLCHNSTRNCNDPTPCHIQHTAGMILPGSAINTRVEWSYFVPQFHTRLQWSYLVPQSHTRLQWSYLVPHSTRGWNDPIWCCIQHVAGIILPRFARPCYQCKRTAQATTKSQSLRFWHLFQETNQIVKALKGELVVLWTAQWNALMGSEASCDESEWWRHIVSDQWGQT